MPLAVLAMAMAMTVVAIADVATVAAIALDADWAPEPIDLMLQLIDAANLLGDQQIAHVSSAFPHTQFRHKRVRRTILTFQLRFISHEVTTPASLTNSALSSKAYGMYATPLSASPSSHGLAEQRRYAPLSVVR